jgi:hypothetical protein
LGTSKKKRLLKKKITPEDDGTLRSIHNKRPDKLIIGTAISDLDNTFTACNHPGTKLDLHVTRVNPNVSESTISNYVNKKLVSKLDNYNSSDISKIVILHSRFPDTRNYSSFKITVDAALFNILLNSSFWTKI